MGYSHGQKWTEEDISVALLKIVKVYNMTTFPTHSEMIEFYGNRALCNRVSKTGGTRYWARKLGLPLKQCESEFGNDFELRAISDIYGATGMKAVQTKPRYPYDLLVNQCIKVDVKVSRQIFTNCHTWQNSFNLEKKDPTCDIFIFYCLDKDGNFIKRLITPACVLAGQTQLGVGAISKWDRYADNWKLFDEYYAFYNKLMEV